MLRRLLLATVVALAFALGACSSSDDDPEPAPTATPVAVESYGEPGAYGVGVMTVVLVDTSRPTPANGAVPATPERRIPLEIWYPTASGGQSPDARDAALDAGGGPYPLIVFAHGFTSSRVQSSQYTRHLASRGYVVASPDFPSSNGGAPGGPRLRGVVEQPGDVSFVIDQLIARDAEAGWPLAGGIDFERIGLTGHSLGGLTTLLTVYGVDADPRIDAALPISPPGCFFSETSAGDVMTPMMVMGGSEELIVDPVSIRRAYDISNPPRYWVEVGGADHIKFADVDINDRDFGGGDVVTRLAGDNLVSDAIEIATAAEGSAGPCVEREGPKGEEYITGDRQREVLRLFGALFFDAYLKDDGAALSLIRGGDLSGVAPETVVEFE
jgi:predicted dienelactone hydrolase